MHDDIEFGDAAGHILNKPGKLYRVVEVQLIAQFAKVCFVGPLSKKRRADNFKLCFRMFCFEERRSLDKDILPFPGADPAN